MKSFIKAFGLPLTDTSDSKDYHFLKQKLGSEFQVKFKLETQAAGLCFISTEEEEEELLLDEANFYFSVIFPISYDRKTLTSNLEKLSITEIKEEFSNSTGQVWSFCSGLNFAKKALSELVKANIAPLELTPKFSKNKQSMLICFKIKVGNSIFELPKNPFIEKWIAKSPKTFRWSIEAINREFLFSNFNSEIESYRLLHKEYDHLTIDKYANTLWFSCFNKQDQKKDIQDFTDWAHSYFSTKSFLYRKMINRGKDPDSKDRAQSENLESQWLIVENNYNILLKADQGQSSGIFLDQRSNRKWVLENAKDKKVLNLFSYTCGFSLAAAMGSAKEVVSVDTSKNSLEWGKENFRQNGALSDNHFFYSMETDRFLDLAIKKSNHFDIIVCDPPSFARNKKTVFKIEKELKPMLEKIDKIMQVGSKLLLSLNFEKWSQRDFESQVFDVFKQSKTKVHRIYADSDYESPNPDGILKWILLEKL